MGKRRRQVQKVHPAPLPYVHIINRLAIMIFMMMMLVMSMMMMVISMMMILMMRMMMR